MNNYRLSLAIHPGVLGWAMRDEQNTEMGVRVFSEGREHERGGKTGMPLGVERRIARQTRKNRRRSKRRKQLTANELIRSGLLPQNAELRNRLKNEHPDCIAMPSMNKEKRVEKNRAWNPYYLRFQALERRLEPLELGKILMHLCIHRGYRSIRIDSVSQQTLERKKNLLKISELEKQLQDSRARTLGKFLWYKVEKNYRSDDDGGGIRETIRFKPDVLSVFPSRTMYETEFDAIREKQKKNFPHIRWEVLKQLIFFQRSLKIPQRIFCPYYCNQNEPHKSEYRGFRTQPSAQRFAIVRTLEKCFWMDSSNILHQLSREQKSVLIAILEQQKSLFLSEAVKRLDLPPGSRFIIKNMRQQKLYGNETSCDMRKLELFGQLWDEISPVEQDKIIELAASGNKKSLAQKLKKHLLLDKQRDAILQFEYNTALAPYSVKFMRNITAIMTKKSCTFDDAVAEFSNKTTNIFSENSFAQLSLYGKILPELISIEPEINYGKTWNPTIHAAFNQIRTVVNELIKKNGKPSEIVLHIARPVKQTRDERDFFRQKKHVLQSDIHTVQTLFAALGAKKFCQSDFVLYKLWKELPDAKKNTAEKICLFCGQPISLDDLVSKNAQATFIIPFERSLNAAGGNSTVAHAECILIKGSRTPHEAFENESGIFAWKKILERTAVLKSQKRALFSFGALPHTIFDESFFAQKVRRYLSTVCPLANISAYTAALPAQVVRSWQLHALCSPQNSVSCSDYRNFALDAFALNCIDTNFLSKLKKINKNVLNPNDVNIPLPHFKTDFLSKKLHDLLVSHKPDHASNGAFFNETALGRHKYFCSLEEKEFRLHDISRIANKKICEKARIRQEQFGWKNAKSFLFNKEHSKITIKKTAFVTRKKLLLCTEADIARIVNRKIRSDLLTLTEEKSGNQLYHALEQYSKKNGVRRVRIIPKGQEAIFIPCAHNKAYAPADFLFVDIWRIPKRNGAYEYGGVFVSRFETSSYRKEQKKPHPAAKYLFRLYKNDTLKIYRDKTNAFYARIAGFATTQQKLDIRPLSAALAIPLWNEQLAENLHESFWQNKNSLQNHTAINSIFSAHYKIAKVVVSPAGKVNQRV